MNLDFSIIVPVYNRPQEIKELLVSLTKQTYKNSFEVIIVEDGSDLSSKTIVDSFIEKLNLQYFYKPNSGAGASRNFGMDKANGNYFIILDSDVIVPETYLENVSKSLEQNYSDAYGGPDAAHDNFTNLQKAINYSMTSVLTTGGIRGNKKAVGKFQPRSFNLGISKIAYQTTKGFSKMRTGEDIDLIFRLWKAGFSTQLIENAFVYHKRRATLKQFLKQVYAFGKARPVLNKNYPQTAKITYWFPSLFSLGLLFSFVMSICNFPYLTLFYALYFLVLISDSYYRTKSIKVTLLSIITTIVQFYAYGYGFLKSLFKTKQFF